MGKHRNTKRRRPKPHASNWNHPTHPIVESALRKVAEVNAIPYEEVKRLFVEVQDIETTDQFWNVIHQEYGERYGQVRFCKNCGEFYLIFSVSGEEGF